MRALHITFTLSSRENSTIRLPSANLHLFQSMLYSLLPQDMAGKLHDEGFSSDGKTLKLFAVGWPVSDSRPQFGEGTIIFPLPVRITVSTPFIELSRLFCAGAMSMDDIRIGNNHLTCMGVERHEERAESDSITVRTLSPVTCYTSTERNGRPYTQYFTPYDENFSRSIRVNLERKFSLLHPESSIPSMELRVTPIGQPRERVSMFEKGGLFPVKGWWGKFRLEGSRELLQTALDCGIGSKNSSGWGCLTLEGDST